jgi:hypothetical protein
MIQGHGRAHSAQEQSLYPNDKKFVSHVTARLVEIANALMMYNRAVRANFMKHVN